ncbi:MAG: hypothetical protein ACFFG0_34890, partial [Candidatus Thorarchaeota archaeon]
MDIIKENKKYKMKSLDDSEESTNYLDIWRENPAYKDVSGTMSNVKLISLMVILFFIVYSAFLLTSNLYIFFGISGFLVILFIVTFNNNIYSLEQAYTYLFRNFAEIRPFDNFGFYMLEEDPATLLIINKKDMVTMATRIYRVEVLAENIKPTINQFLYALDESKIPYTYQVVQKPIIKLEENDTHHKKKFSHLKNPRINIIDSYRTYIYFSLYHVKKGTLSLRKLNNLINTIIIYSRSLKSNFNANFHHTKIALLKRRDNNYKNEEDKDETKEDLINAIRTLVYGKPIRVTHNNNPRSNSNIKILSTLFKLICIALIIFSASFILLQFKVPLIYLLGVDIVIVCIVLFLWWRELLFFLTNLQMNRYNISQIYPFSDVKFYSYKKFRDTLYIQINNILLLGIKMFNLRNAIQPSFAMPDKFFRSINSQKTPFTYTLNATPIERKEFVKKCT